ncbi:hypothetical protein [Cellulomonas endophytica]|uniref:hypothetical protein n=1 Tax=Cellulomonas endophytica TaxID=2494735 RepID=UPI0010135420|nr:hypothetical protein [Cellulomonas endophytica]
MPLVRRPSTPSRPTRRHRSRTGATAPGRALLAGLALLLVPGCGATPGTTSEGTSAPAATDVSAAPSAAESPAATTTAVPASADGTGDGTGDGTAGATGTAAGWPAGAGDAVAVFLDAWRSGDGAVLATFDGGDGGVALEGATARATTGAGECSPEPGTAGSPDVVVCAFDVEEGDHYGLVVRFSPRADGTWSASGGPSGWG